VYNRDEKVQIFAPSRYNIYKGKYIYIYIYIFLNPKRTGIRIFT